MASQLTKPGTLTLLNIGRESGTESEPEHAVAERGITRRVFVPFIIDDTVKTFTLRFDVG